MEGLILLQILLAWNTYKILDKKDKQNLECSIQQAGNTPAEVLRDQDLQGAGVQSEPGRVGCKGPRQEGAWGGREEAQGL